MIKKIIYSVHKLTTLLASVDLLWRAWEPWESEIICAHTPQPFNAPVTALSFHIWLTVTSSIQRRAVGHTPTGVTLTWPIQTNRRRENGRFKSTVHTKHVYVRVTEQEFQRQGQVNVITSLIFSFCLPPSTSQMVGCTTAALETAGCLAQGHFNNRVT